MLPLEQLAVKYFGADAPWFLRNIPFLEIDDAEIQQIYYYRWMLFRSHIRDIGPQGTTVLEFLDNVPWARQPYTDLNDSASFHIMEGRWLRDPSFVDSLIDHLYTGGANDRHFSESIAAATESSTRATGDPAPALRHLDTMQHIFNLWDDHFDRARNLYWIEPLLDATEYSIASIDASGAGVTEKPSTDQNHNGFTGGYAFRPSINGYQYANALAIARLASLAGNPDVASDYARRAENIRLAVLTQLWNPELQHFTDRYQRSTQYVTAGEFIRGRELVGFVPWFYELPPNDPSTPADYAIAWRHLLSAAEFAGPYGLRTVEPSYPRYLTQYRHDQATGMPECQWNGPSWPFQTSQVLTALANLLDDYSQSVITRADYLRLLRQYTHQHYSSPDHADIQEDYNPDTGEPIVGLARSHHYNHSTYIDLIVTGLIGIRPRADENLELDPLITTDSKPNEARIRYFALQNVAYHGHDVSVIYDSDGSRYGIGRGLFVFVDGECLLKSGPLARTLIPLPRGASGAAKPIGKRAGARVNFAVNPGVPGGPVATASSSVSPTAAGEAIDGRLWFFSSNPNGWSPAPSDNSPISWYAIDFRERRTIGSVELYFFADGEKYKAPSAFRAQYQTPGGWQDIPQQQRAPQQPLANGENAITFPPLSAQELRIVLTNPPSPGTFRLVEVRAFAP
jgi:F5/8 type C domain/Amylo-alpha-1,6-glucosidase